MSDHVVNQAIERIMTDDTLFRQVVVSGQSALGEYDLTDREVADIVAAVMQDARVDDPSTFAALRTVARFDHLFGAASASATKSG
jgi:hypothetical protein